MVSSGLVTTISEILIPHTVHDTLSPNCGDVMAPNGESNNKLEANRFTYNKSRIKKKSEQKLENNGVKNVEASVNLVFWIRIDVV